MLRYSCWRGQGVVLADGDVDDDEDDGNNNTPRNTTPKT
jgi:hypothetical protein